MERIKLSSGDMVRIVAPSHSLAIISQEVRALATNRLQKLGLRISFGKHVEECNDFFSSSIASRVEDLHQAFRDTEVKAILAVIGGYAANQILPHLDWKLIEDNPKPILGYSDTTVLQNALYKKAGIISYSSPAFSTFGQDKYFDYTLEHFKKCLIEDGSFILSEADEWTDDLWFLDQEDRHPIKNEGWFLFGSGKVAGTIIGGNLSSLRLLQGTQYFPNLKDSILFIEDDELVSYSIFDRELEALTQNEAFSGVKGIVIGRFQKKSEMSKERLRILIESKQALKNIPIIANVDFGHTSPIITFPIGGSAILSIEERRIQIN